MAPPPLSLLLPLLLPVAIDATVTLSDPGKQIHSRPAAFGLDFEFGLQYVALLQADADDPHLCGGQDDAPAQDTKFGEALGAYGRLAGYGQDIRRALGAWAGNDGEGGGDDQEDDHDHGDEEGRRGLRMSASELLPMGKSNTESWSKVNIGHLVENLDQTSGDEDIHVVPSHGVPVALLAKRGQCAYETKARVAATRTSPHGAVRFVIVYDDQAEDGNHLIEMMPRQEGLGHRRDRRHDLYKDVGLVFVSYESGVELQEFLNSQSEYTTNQGGPRILIDGSDPWIFPPMDQSAAGMAFMLVLFGCVCSVSLFINTNLYNERGFGRSNNMFLLGPDGQTTSGGGGGSSRGGRGGRSDRLRLLTMEEVETLPTREYHTPDAPPEDSLELRDKSEMPYPTNGGGAEDGSQQRQSSSLHDAGDNSDDDGNASQGGGGLCEHLSASLKKPDPYLDQNTCSICLDEYSPGEEIRVLPCQHTFHSQCIFPWLTERSPTCPLCKAMFEAVQYDAEAEEEDSGGNDREADAAAEGNGQGLEGRERSATTEESAAPLSEEQQLPQRGMYRRLRNLFGPPGTAAAANAAVSSNALEESLLASDGLDGNDTIV